MRIELRKLSEIKPYPGNPRINDDAVNAVATSIREFGFRQPIVVDTEGVIVCGHSRYKAALKLALETVPVHVAEDLTPEQVRAYRIADNKTAELSEWNYDLLPIELAELQGMDYDLGLLGFDQDELGKLLQSNKSEVDDETSEQETDSVFIVIAMCADEVEQKLVYDLLRERKIKCRVSTLY